MVNGILVQGSSRLSDMARANPDQKQQESKEKQMSCWLQNRYSSYAVHYLPYVVALLKSLSQAGKLVFSLVGSSAGQGYIVLIFSVLYKKQAIPVVWHVVKSKKGHLAEQTHRGLLKRLAEIVPLSFLKRG